MKALLDKLPFLHQSTRRQSAGGRVVIVHWDHEAIDYLIVGGKSSKVAASDRGRVAWAGFDNPLLALSEHLRSTPGRPQRLIVLLSRPLLEQLSLTLPEAEQHELPELVAAAVEQQLGEMDVPHVVDFYSQPSLSEAGTGHVQHVLAFALAAAELDRLRQWCQQASLRLTAVCSRELSPLGILRRKNVAEDSLNISVHLVSGEAELAVCRGAEPVYLRLIRTAIDDPQRLADQVWMETQRCLTILPAEMADLPQAWFVFTTCEAAWHVARSLEDRGMIVQPVDPLFGWQVEPLSATSPAIDGNASSATDLAAATGPPDIAAAPTEQPASDSKSAPPQDADAGVEDDNDTDASDDAHSNEADSAVPASVPAVKLAQQTSAANAGAAWEYLHGELPINLLAPKKAPTPPNPLHRWGAIAAAVLAVAGLGIYFLLADVNTMRREVAELRSEVAEEKKLAAKFQEKADQVTFVETWLSDQVDWLAELNELSARLPDGELATVRRLTASANGSMARVDLSLQVAHQENIAQLENRIRSAKYQATSQRISQNADSTEYPWQFETQITFPVEPPQREAYAAGKAAAESLDHSTQVPLTETVSAETVSAETVGTDPTAENAAGEESAADEPLAALPVASIAPAESASPSDKSEKESGDNTSDVNTDEDSNSSADTNPEVAGTESTEQDKP